MLLPCTKENIERAAKILSGGGLVAFPTETVYGLGADAFNKEALVRIFEVKSRPFFDPLIVHIADLDSLHRLVNFDVMCNAAKQNLKSLCEVLWPGALTLVLPKNDDVPLLATGGLETVAVRFPDNETALNLIRFSTGAIAAPSANPFGYLSPTRAKHVEDQLGDKVDIILDGGKTAIGIESTVLDLSCTRPKILRQGGVEQEKIEKIIGKIDNQIEKTYEANQKISSPGQLKSHYSPKTRLILHKTNEIISMPFEKKEAFLFFDDNSAQHWREFNKNECNIKQNCVFILSFEGDLNEAAANLFDILHKIDSLGFNIIHAEYAADFGLGRAINDRLARAGVKV
ncbi:threonylcarbamoyl-AMP synthase [Spirochaetia bacterium]|nr:threonylcarbamoyl-AMP synthase [Spirochaetia bacterium]